MRKDEEVKRIEFLLTYKYREDREVIDWLEQVPNRGEAIRSVLFEYVSGSRVRRQQETIERLEHELALLRRVVDRLSQVNSK
jgi:hypothetical protein